MKELQQDRPPQPRPVTLEAAKRVRDDLVIPEIVTVVPNAEANSLSNDTSVDKDSTTVTVSLAALLTDNVATSPLLAAAKALNGLEGARIQALDLVWVPHTESDGPDSDVQSELLFLQNQWSKVSYLSWSALVGVLEKRV